MADKVIDRDIVAAKNLAEETEELYLDLGVSTLNEQLPYFLDLMNKYCLNPLNQDHLRYVRESLEGRLEPKENNGIDKLPIIDSGQPLSMLDDLNFEESYLKECERVKDQLVSVYNEYIYLGINDFTCKFSMMENENCYTELKFKDQTLIVRYADKREKDYKVWGNEHCPHGLFDTKIENGRVSGSVCTHVDNHKWKEFLLAAKEYYKFYFETSTDLAAVKRFQFYFDMFTSLPVRITLYACPSERKKIDAANKIKLKDARDSIKDSYFEKLGRKAFK